MKTKHPCHWKNGNVPCNQDGELRAVCNLYYCDKHFEKMMRLRIRLQAFGQAKKENPSVQIFAFV